MTFTAAIFCLFTATTNSAASIHNDKTASISPSDRWQFFLSTHEEWQLYCTGNLYQLGHSDSCNAQNSDKRNPPVMTGSHTTLA